MLAYVLAGLTAWTNALDGVLLVVALLAVDVATNRLWVIVHPNYELVLVVYKLFSKLRPTSPDYE